MKSFYPQLILVLLLAAFSIEPKTFAQSTQPGVNLPGQRPDGSVLLPNQWSLHPVGKQVILGDFPVNVAVHPDGHFAAVLHSGDSANEIVIVDLDHAAVASRMPVNESFYGIEFARSGARLYCSGGGDDVVHMFDFKDGNLKKNSDIALCSRDQRGVPCGLAVGANFRDLYVTALWGQYVSKLDTMLRTNMMDYSMVEGQTEIARQTGFGKKDDEDEDTAAITKRAKVLGDPTTPEAPFPYACRVDDRHQLLYISLWGRAKVAVLDLKTGQWIKTLATQEHPNEMVLNRSGRLLYVANANRNTVSVIDTTTGLALENLYASFLQNDPPGSTPSSLALTPDENTLFVANSCNNDVAVFDVSVAGRSRSLGLIPVGWYPTSVRVTPDGRHLLVANGKGLKSLANPEGPQPGKKGKGKGTQYIGSLFPGALSIIDLPAKKQFASQLAEWTKQAYASTPANSVGKVTPSAGNPVPANLGDASPIKHCIYVIRENRTYDQVLGDVKTGNGDPSLCLFPEKVTPNLHKIVSEFAQLDNFYVDAEVSADGHEWSMAAYATDFVEKTWPLDYGHNHSRKFPYPSEGHFPIARPANGYIWDRANEAGLNYFSFGEFVSNPKTTNEPCFTMTAALKGHFDPGFWTFDTDYPDVRRAERFIHELKRFENEGALPSLVIVRLPNDHTAGGSAGKLTPTSLVADNDLALGMVVEAISRSKFWPETAIFVLEDDAQNGPDHVDAHRSPGLVISPYTRHRGVDSTMYSTTSMLRTMELILGLKPLSQFDLATTPMYNAFVSKPDFAPYEHVEAQVSLTDRNPKKGKNADQSRLMNLKKEDMVDDRLMNEVIWRSVRGEKSKMPAPVRAAFVMVNPKTDSDD